MVWFRSSTRSTWLSRSCSSSTASVVAMLQAVMQYAQSMRTGGWTRATVLPVRTVNSSLVRISRFSWMSYR